VRAGGDVPKQFRPLGGARVVDRAIAAFAAHPGVDAVWTVLDAAHLGDVAGNVVAGGATRQASVCNGLEAIAAAGGAERVLVHDAARPMLPASVIDRVLAALDGAPGAIPALPVVDSLRTGADTVTGEVSRDGLWRVQTPQGFRFDAILAAHRTAAEGATDDAEILRAAGHVVALVEGDEMNMKITGEGDHARLEAMLRVSRTASGFDVHRFGPGDHVWLCGVRIPHTHGLLGHSDADAGLHALTDALLGCIGAGDIGDHFPPSDPKWKGAASDRFLAHAAALVRARGGIVDHVDVTLICERPKIGPHREAMRRRISEILEIDMDRVSVKATTTEGLGFTGRSEGIAAQATATVRA
jgi:2-C-methyl-D-erythritol 4-phosphate cytidylyltransferase/2-C-methyl-D-erythritol 2,4-cyclodiphosphate synthase